MAPEAVVGRVFGVDPTAVGDATCNADVPGWDSMGHIALIVELESEYGAEFSAEEALRMTSVGAIKGVLEERGVRW
ncbi:MAG TPA: acyl carrier protein [Longimicrobiales bacterium]|nr:acyl carrier protein [Longimicrobiales bacterium]